MSDSMVNDMTSPSSDVGATIENLSLNEINFNLDIHSDDIFGAERSGLMSVPDESK